MFPRYVFFQIGDYCNGRCTFCPRSRPEFAFPRGRMDDGLLEQALEEVQRHREECELLGINFRCEPTLDRRLAAWCERMAAVGYRPRITTNGTMMHLHDIDRIVAHVSTVHFSLHGGPDPAERDRVMPGLDHEATLGNLAAVARAAARLPEERRPTVMVSDMFCPPEQQSPRREQLRRIVGGAALSVEFTPLFQRTPESDRGIDRGPRVRCQSFGPALMAGLLWDGTMIICAEDWARQFSPGRAYRDGGLEALFNSPVAEEFRAWASGRRDLPPGHLCRRCTTAQALHE